MNIPEVLVQEVRRGRVVLFLGAGASRGAKRKDGTEPPDGTRLAEMIRKRFLGADFPDLPLAQLAEVAIAEAGLGAVQEFVAEQLRDYEPAPHHVLIPSFVWYGIATTNYDLIVEQAYRTNKALQNLNPVSTRGRNLDEIARSGGVNYLKLVVVQG